MKIVILDGYTANPGDLSWAKFEKIGELTVYDRTSANQIVERIGDAEIVLTNKTVLGKEIFKQTSNLRYVGVLATGFNVVDVAAAREFDITVTNIPSYSTEAVGQLTIALLLEICHHVGHHDREIHEGRWENSEDFCFWDYPLIELKGKTIGIIGFGKIGQSTGRIAKALGMNVIACGSRPSEEGKTIAEYVDEEELLKRSDVISLHCPLTERTQGIINQNSIGKMKDGVILLNTSRGPLLVEEEVAAALNSGKIYAAAVDVVSQEPILTTNPLLKAKNCVMTPHIAWAPKEARQRLVKIAEENVTAFVQGNPQNVVN
ncbi:D-2-hydroxyacid dehydrogenase [Scatolibacter rhodanostii]|uniref:D-2-hydroxyacid dehydrogenase n=1 Tax=Scatolibacter rhodanostii TaxID=2014781 RepID=UPI000C06B129|nr:D-2-hydroxyacid dehydrogenase [Scatolibacter rhodanostii]